MKKLARRVLAVLVLVLPAGFILPGSGAPGAVRLAQAVVPTPTPTPTRTLIPNLFPSPTPSPSPTRGEEEEEGEKDKDDDGDKDGDGDKDRRKRKGDRKDGKGKGKGEGRNGRQGRDGKRGDNPLDFPIPPRIPGAYNTDRLLAAAVQLRALGWSEKAVVESVFPPFIIAGPASWVDTWGAPRFGPGPLVRTHQGQDVFCTYGDPVLATESGVVEFDEGGLGGMVARLHVDDGSYWYYAHLSGWNTAEFASGDRVDEGDVLGYCGTSGNAATTPPHVHFGWYGAGGILAHNPMRSLIDWLREAEINAAALISDVTGDRVRNIDRLRLARRFGDSFAPDRSEFVVPSESLWAAGSTPASGAFVVARGALQEALAGALVPSPGHVPFGTGDPTMPPGAELEVQPSVSISPALTELLSAAWPWRDELAD